ncbi:hypothetical protein NLI96_g10885 [Meripilus lineatus]|uniref:Uncharacterized protein n=1 Tax=Meripilus lineatus TaxID=2056292 RepID=A0AAD5UT45_9APHY|nr:hypothetical protein NLI96_g10885 [Physisporinus lineatus]
MEVTNRIPRIPLVGVSSVLDRDAPLHFPLFIYRSEVHVLQLLNSRSLQVRLRNKKLPRIAVTILNFIPPKGNIIHLRSLQTPGFPPAQQSQQQYSAYPNKRQGAQASISTSSATPGPCNPTTQPPVPSSTLPPSSGSCHYASYPPSGMGGQQHPSQRPVNPSNDHRERGSEQEGIPPRSPQPTEEQDPVSLEEKINRMAEINAYEQARREKEIRAIEEERERRRKAAEHAERVEREREQERRHKAQREERWLRGPWTPQRALERYKALAESFDAAKYSAENPVDFWDIPWPVLHRPTTFLAQDVDWSAVEAFFSAAKSSMEGQDYTAFVEESHRRFHPDRWSARRVLLGIRDNDIRQTMETAANTVAQVITPLWKEVRKGT